MRERLLTAIAVTGSCALLYLLFHFKSKKKNYVKTNKKLQEKETNLIITSLDEGSLTIVNQIQGKAVCENIHFGTQLPKENSLLEEELPSKLGSLEEMGLSSTITCDENKFVINKEHEISANCLIPIENVNNSDLELFDKKCIENFQDVSHSCITRCSEEDLEVYSALSNSFSINQAASSSSCTSNYLESLDRLPEQDNNERHTFESVKEKEESIKEIQIEKNILNEVTDLVPSDRLELVSDSPSNVVSITSNEIVTEMHKQVVPIVDSKNIRKSNKKNNLPKNKKLRRKGKENLINETVSYTDPVKSNSGNLMGDQVTCISQQKMKISEHSVEATEEGLNLNQDKIFSGTLEREASPEQDIGTSDSHSLVSQGSFDSGQGSIDVEPDTIFSSSSMTRLKSTENYIFYQFQVPQHLVGRLIGKKGTFINKLKDSTSTTIVVLEHSNSDFRICSIEGQKSKVIKALEMVRRYFPIDDFPELTLDQMNSPCSTPNHHSLMNRQILQVELPPGVVAEVQASAIVSTGEVWLQQPLHPTFSALHRLHNCLSLNYGDGTSTPAVPLPIRPNTVCVCKIGAHWLRCQTLSHNDEMCTATLLDIGGIVTFPITLLRQIRVDYVGLPFQAAQSFLHGIRPINDNGWNEEGRLSLEELIKGRIIFATIAAYTQEGIPLVNLYQRNHNQYIYVNEKLVELGHAKWISTIPNSDFIS